MTTRLILYSRAIELFPASTARLLPVPSSTPSLHLRYVPKRHYLSRRMKRRCDFSVICPLREHPACIVLNHALHVHIVSTYKKDLTSATHPRFLRCACLRSHASLQSLTSETHSLPYSPLLCIRLKNTIPSTQ